MPALKDVDPGTPGGRIRFLRIAKGWSQTELGRRAHASQAAVARWELNDICPHFAAQCRIAEALGCSRAFLYPDVPERMAS